MSRRYPIPRPADDSRFTFGLILDVALVLAEHGYPPMTGESYDGQGPDLVDLQQALFGLIYTTEPAPVRREGRIFTHPDMLTDALDGGRS